MTGLRFDRIAQRFASRRARRTAVLHAQGATPDADPTSATTRTPHLFVQSFESGTIAPKEGEDGTYTLTLQHGLGQTIYFGDRPNRDVGATPTPDFLQALGFSDTNPPNAALVIDDGNGGTDIAVVELRNPLFDPVSPGVIYDITVLQNWADSLGLGLTEAPGDLSSVPATFGSAHLFIDDCGNYDVVCYDDSQRGCVGTFAGIPYCFESVAGACVPCEGRNPYHAFDLGALRNYWTSRCVNERGCTSGACHAENLAWYDSIRSCEAPSPFHVIVD